VVEALPEEEEEIERPGPTVEESLFKSNITHEIEDINKHPQTTKQSQQPDSGQLASKIALAVWPRLKRWRDS
jgi:hypothetical protein